MRNSRGRVTPKSDVRSWSRREVLARGAGVASLLALPQLWIPKAWGQTTQTFDYYISPTGSDSNPGTLAAPWALTSLSSASSNLPLIAGKRTGILPGTYTIPPTFPVSAAQSSSGESYAWGWLNLPSGTQANPTYVGGCNSSGQYSPRLATIVWGGGPSTGSPYSIFANHPGATDNCAWMTLDGLILSLGSAPATATSGNQVVQFVNQSSTGTTGGGSATIQGVVIQNCDIGHMTANNGLNFGLIRLEGVYNALIQNNYLHDLILNGADASHAAASCEISCYGNQWLYNTIYNTPGGLWVKESVSSGTAAYNYFYSVATTAAEIAGYCAAFIGWDGAENSSGPGKLFSLHHNVIEACGASHKPVGGTNPVLTVIGINAYNNTVYDTQTVANVGWLLSCESSTCEFYNNIYMTSKGSSGQLSAQPGKLCVSNGATLFANVNNNCYYDSTGAYSSFWSTAGLGGSGGSAYSSFTSWKSAIAAVVSGSESHSIQSNPNFTLPGGYVAGGGAAQFQLLPGSPCIGTGEGGVNIGAWDGTSSQIGCSFALGGGTGNTAVPSAPTLTVS
jgi:hypothetical protein